VSDFWSWYSRSKQQAKLEQIPLFELDWLIARTTHIDKLALRLEQGDLDRDRLAKLEQLWQRRITEKIPVQYLVGSVTWRNLELTVTPAVLIPRPETELIIDLIVELVNDPSAVGNWVDLGTGSGAIALGLAQVLPNCLIHAVDWSEDALSIAAINVANNHLVDRIKLDHGQWFEPLSELKLKINGMVSNPPYIPTAEIAHLQPEVAQHEPHLALDGGVDGLEAVQHLIDTAPAYLISGGYWIVELMAGQADIVRSRLKAQGSYNQIQTHFDRAGIERFVSARKI